MITMIAKLALAFLLAIPGVVAAQEKMADQLRKAIVEEEVNLKLDRAIDANEKIMTQYDGDRKVAATALFHLAECYRKLGQKDKAILAYGRLLMDFSDQIDLVDASRNQIVRFTNLGQLAAFLNQRLARIQEVQNRLQHEIEFMGKQHEEVKKQVNIGMAAPHNFLFIQLQIDLLNMQKGETESEKNSILQLKKIVDSGVEAMKKSGLY